MMKFLTTLLLLSISWVGCGSNTAEAPTADSTTAPPSVVFEQADHVIDVAVLGEPFTAFHYEEKWDKPFLYPLTTASGKVISRGYPIEPREGEANDHAWHRGIWYGHGDMNGEDFWRERGREITSMLVLKAAPTTTQDTLSVELSMQTPGKTSIGTIAESFTFSGTRNQRIIDALIEVRADQGTSLKFGDTDDGGFAFRLADGFREDQGGASENAEGQKGTDAIWGKASKWTNYSAKIDGKQIGVAIFDNPKNIRHPTTWHARGYSLNSANPFATKSFTGDETKDGSYTIAEGESVTFHYRLVIHEGLPGEVNVEELYQDYVR